MIPNEFSSYAILLDIEGINVILAFIRLIQAQTFESLVDAYITENHATDTKSICNQFYTLSGILSLLHVRLYSNSSIKDRIYTSKENYSIHGKITTLICSRVKGKYNIEILEDYIQELNRVKNFLYQQKMA